MSRCAAAVRRGFTILEVVLTLSMAVVLMSLVGATLQFYAGNLNVRDLDVRRVHLASSILQMLADDLRAAVHSDPFDSSQLENYLAASAGEAIAQSLDPAASAVLGLDAPGAGTLEAPGMAADSLDLQGSMLTLQRPGLIGNQTELQFDISRLPRLEQWQTTLGSAPAEVTDVPSDLKTVTYYVQPLGTMGGVPDPLQSYLPQEIITPQGAAPGGLVRRQLDRQATQFSLETSGVAGLMASGELIAAEIAGLEFSYFDGLQWQMYWNSDDMQALPIAIQIKLTLADPTRQAAAGDPAAVDPAAAPRVFTQIVHLPAGRPSPTLTGTAEVLP